MSSLKKEDSQKSSGGGGLFGSVFTNVTNFLGELALDDGEEDEEEAGEGEEEDEPTVVVRQNPGPVPTITFKAAVTKETRRPVDAAPTSKEGTVLTAGHSVPTEVQRVDQHITLDSTTTNTTTTASTDGASSSGTTQKPSSSTSGKEGGGKDEVHIMHAWRAGDETSFSTRIGPNYYSNKQKSASPSSVLEFLGTEYVMYHIYIYIYDV